MQLCHQHALDKGLGAYGFRLGEVIKIVEPGRCTRCKEELKECQR